MSIGLLGILLLSGYWYLRNFLVTGSPLYPMGASSGSNDLEQLYPNVWKSTFLGSGRLEVPWLTLLAVGKIAGPCQVLALCAFPAAVGWLLLAGRHTRTACQPARRAFVRATLGAGAVWLLTPFAVECVPGTLDQLLYERTPVRYGLTFLSLAVVAVALAAELVASERRWRGLTRGVLGTLLAAQFALTVVNPPRGLTSEVMRGLHVEVGGTTLFALAVLLVGCLVALGGQRAPRCTTWLFTTSLVVAAGVGGAALSSAWHEGFNRHYNKMFRDNVFATLTTSGVPDGARLCVLDDRPYPFFGARRQFRVCVPLVLADLSALNRFVADQGIDILVVRAGSNFFPTNLRHNRLATKWVTNPSLQLTMLHAGPNYSVYRVLPSQSTQATGVPPCLPQRP
jgi:hypothetical protein